MSPNNYSLIFLASIPCKLLEQVIYSHVVSTVLVKDDPARLSFFFSFLTDVHENIQFWTQKVSNYKYPDIILTENLGWKLHIDYILGACEELSHIF